MKNKKIHFLSIGAIIFAGSFLASCNNNIFVDHVPDLESDTYYLKCDGSSKSFTIPTKGFRDVRFDCDHHYMAGVEYYDKNGEYIDNPTLDEVAKAVYSSPYFYIEFDVDGGNIKVKAMDNTTADNVRVWVGLDYEHTTKYIDFVITPGRPLEIEHLGYDIVRPVSGIYTERGMSHTFTNNSGRIQQIVIYPYKEAKSSIKLDIEDGYYIWAIGVKGIINVPFYYNGEWLDSQTNTAEVTIGDVTQFYCPDLDIEESYTVEVAPYSKVTTVTPITYATLDVAFIANMKQPNSGYTYMAGGKCQLMQPISYTIEKQ